MIGFNMLGQLGRLGNQMFQVASLRGIASNNDYNYAIPPSKNKNEWTDHQLFNPFVFEGVNPLNIQFIDFQRPQVEEASFSFDEKTFQRIFQMNLNNNTSDPYKILAHIVGTLTK